MFTIYFETYTHAKEALLYFSQHINKGIITLQDQTSLLFSPSTSFHGEPIEIERVLCQMLHSFILDCYEKKWVINLLSTKYFFNETHEQEAISDILEAIFIGEMRSLPMVKKLSNREKVLERCLTDLFHSTRELTFHSIQTFRLLPYHQLLQKYTEIAIDEYKLQEEYQTFIEKLTTMIRAFRPLHHTVYVADNNDSIQLYNESFEAIDHAQTLRSFYPMLKQWGVDAEPSPLLALIALAPEKVIVYSDRPILPIIMTMSRVFGSRLIRKKAEEFTVLPYEKA